MNLNKGFGVWMYGASVQFLDDITSYNHLVQPERQILYLYPYSEVVNFTLLGRGNPVPESVRTFPGVLDFYAEKIPKGISLFPMIDGSFYNQELDRRVTIPEKKVEELAEHLHEKYALYVSRIQGIHLDFEPVLEEHLSLYRILKKRLAEPLNLPLSIAVGRRGHHAPLFREVDDVVLMCYDCNADPKDIYVPPEIYTHRAKSRIASFLKNVQEAGCYFSIGLPAAATSFEYETRKELSGAVISGATSMVDYLKDIYDYVMDISSTSTKFRGITLWTLKNSAHKRKNPPFFTCPEGISPSTWDWLKKKGK